MLRPERSGRDGSLRANVQPLCGNEGLVPVEPGAVEQHGGRRRPGPVGCQRPGRRRTGVPRQSARSHRATQLHSPSLYPGLSASATRNRIGRANRYLFWNDILRFKEQGLKWFDFGGWYPGTTDQTLLRINQFKKGFGGDLLREYECEQIVSLKGWLVLNVAKRLEQAKCFRSGSSTPV